MKKLVVAVWMFLLVWGAGRTQQASFHFVVTGDAHMYRYDEGAGKIHMGFRDDLLKHVQEENVNGPGDFIIVAGDMDPFRRVRSSVRAVMGAAYGFYPVIGNHDVGGTNNHGQDYPEDNWQNAFEIVKYNKDSLSGIVRWGPDVASPDLEGSYEKEGVRYVTYYDSANIHGAKFTSYSFDHGNSHFVILDEYAVNSWGNRGNGRIWSQLFDWLKRDLDSTDKENIFVFGHEPLWSSGTLDDTPVSRDSFWEVLKQHKVVAYFCGHVHDYAITDHEGVWEVRPSCAFEYTWKAHYSMVFVDSGVVKLKTYELQPEGFRMIDAKVLKGDGTVEPDNIPPVANAGKDQTVMDADGNGLAQVVLDGTDSYDTDGRIVSWLWQEDSVQIGTDSIVSHTFGVGSHHVTLEVKDNEGAGDRDECTIVVFGNATYRKEDVSYEKILLYPNPTQGDLNIQPPPGVHMNKLEVFDVSGKRMLSNSNPGMKEIHLDLRCLNPGLYFIKFVVENSVQVSPVILK